MICPHSVLEDHLYELLQKLWSLNKGMEPIALTQVSSKEAHCNLLKLPLNYQQHMVRYQFKTPPNTGSHNAAMARTGQGVHWPVDRGLSR